MGAFRSVSLIVLTWFFLSGCFSVSPDYDEEGGKATEFSDVPDGTDDSGPVASDDTTDPRHGKTDTGATETDTGEGGIDTNEGGPGDSTDEGSSSKPTDTATADKPPSTDTVDDTERDRDTPWRWGEFQRVFPAPSQLAFDRFWLLGTAPIAKPYNDGDLLLLEDGAWIGFLSSDDLFPVDACGSSAARATVRLSGFPTGWSIVTRRGKDWTRIASSEDRDWLIHTLLCDRKGAPVIIEGELEGPKSVWTWSEAHQWHKIPFPTAEKLEGWIHASYSPHDDTLWIGARRLDHVNHSSPAILLSLHNEQWSRYELDTIFEWRDLHVTSRKDIWSILELRNSKTPQLVRIDEEKITPISGIGPALRVTSTPDGSPIVLASPVQSPEGLLDVYERSSASDFSRLKIPGRPSRNVDFAVDEQGTRYVLKNGKLWRGALGRWNPLNDGEIGFATRILSADRGDAFLLLDDGAILRGSGENWHLETSYDPVPKPSFISESTQSGEVIFVSEPTVSSYSDGQWNRIPVDYRKASNRTLDSRGRLWGISEDKSIVVYEDGFWKDAASQSVPSRMPNSPLLSSDFSSTRRLLALDRQDGLYVIDLYGKPWTLADGSWASVPFASRFDPLVELQTDNAGRICGWTYAGRVVCMNDGGRLEDIAQLPNSEFQIVDLIVQADDTIHFLTERGVLWSRIDGEWTEISAQSRWLHLWLAPGGAIAYDAGLYERSGHLWTFSAGHWQTREYPGLMGHRWLSLAGSLETRLFGVSADYNNSNYKLFRIEEDRAEEIGNHRSDDYRYVDCNSHGLCWVANRHEPKTWRLDPSGLVDLFVDAPCEKYRSIWSNQDGTFLITCEKGRVIEATDEGLHLLFHRDDFRAKGAWRKKNGELFVAAIRRKDLSSAILRTQGITWIQEAGPPLVWDIQMLGQDSEDLYFFLYRNHGRERFTAVIHHLDGQEWSRFPSLETKYGLRESNEYRAGPSGPLFNFGCSPLSLAPLFCNEPHISFWDGSHWKLVDVASRSYTSIEDVWVSASGDLYAITDEGIVLRAERTIP